MQSNAKIKCHGVMSSSFSGFLHTYKFTRPEKMEAMLLYYPTCWITIITKENVCFMIIAPIQAFSIDDMAVRVSSLEKNFYFSLRRIDLRRWRRRRWMRVKMHFNLSHFERLWKLSIDFTAMNFVLSHSHIPKWTKATKSNRREYEAPHIHGEGEEDRETCKNEETLAMKFKNNIDFTPFMSHSHYISKCMRREAKSKDHFNLKSNNTRLVAHLPPWSYVRRHATSHWKYIYT